MEIKDKELIEKIQQEKSSKHLIILLERYKPLIYSRAGNIYNLHRKSLMDFDDILRIFEFTFCNLVKKYDTTSVVNFAGYISFYLPNRVKDTLRKEFRTKKTTIGNDIEYHDHLSMFQRLSEIDSIERATLKLEDIRMLVETKTIPNLFSEKELILIKNLAQNKTAKEISESQGINIDQVYRDIYNIRMKIKNLIK